MTELVITQVADAWANNTTSPDRRGQRYGDTDGVTINGGGTPKRGFLKPELPNIAGRTVLDAYITGHGASALSAQTITVSAVAEKWQEGRLTWNNQPSVVSGSAIPCSVSATAANLPVDLTGLAAIFQSVADGADWHGVRLTTSATSDQRFWSTDSGKPAWSLHLTLSEEVDVATGLKPDGGAVEATSPVVSWDPMDDQVKSWVQVDTPVGGADPDEVSPDYSSGWQTNGDPSWSLVSRRTLVGAGPHYFRVQLETTDGTQTGWSDWAEFTVAAMPSLIVDSPTGAFGDPSPLVAAHLSSGTVKSWDVMVTGASRADVRYFSELRTSTTVSLTVPETVRGKRVLREDEAGEIRVRVWPEGDWATAIGQLPYREVWISAEFDDDLLLTPPTNFSVSQLEAGDPRHLWTWDDTETADAYLLQVDGVTVARVEPDDLDINAGTYSYTDNGEISPIRPHELGVRRVEGNDRSEAVTLSEHTHSVHGVWLLPEDDIAPIRLDGDVIGGWTSADAVATYVTLEGREVDVIYGTPGRSAVFEGQVWKQQAESEVWATLDRVKALRQSKSRLARMVAGSDSMRVFVRSPQATSANDLDARNVGLHNVRFGFVEVD